MLIYFSIFYSLGPKYFWKRAGEKPCSVRLWIDKCFCRQWWEGLFPNSDVKEVYHLTRIASGESICGSCWNKGRLLKNQCRIICVFIVFIEIQPFHCFRGKMCKKLEKWDPLKYNLEPMAIRVKKLFAYVDSIEVDINR